MKHLDGLYGAVVAAKNSLYDRGILSTKTLRWPVISVGNISAGGSGKTPFVIMLGELLKKKGMQVDVLSRGYHRRTTGVLRVDASGTPEEFGDEPLLIARKLQCLVFVGEDRHAAGMHAEHDSQPNTSHLLDDGFQHRRLHRDFDIVLLNREDLEDRLLPVGRLRESLSGLGRADAVVVDESFPTRLLAKVEVPIWKVQRSLDVPHMTAPVIAFAGVARPQRFFAELRAAALDVREEIPFRDHHRYSARDVELLAAERQRRPGSVLATTEKDAINLGEHLAALKPVVVPMQMKLIEAEAALEYIFETIACRRGSKPE